MCTCDVLPGVPGARARLSCSFVRRVTCCTLAILLMAVFVAADVVASGGSGNDNGCVTVLIVPAEDSGDNTGVVITGAVGDVGGGDGEGTRE